MEQTVMPLAWRVKEYFRQYPDEELTSSDIALKFGVKYTDVQPCLNRHKCFVKSRKEIRDSRGALRETLVWSYEET